MAEAWAEAFLKAFNVFSPEVLWIVRHTISTVVKAFNLRSVDDTDHTALAMFGLCAVEPHRSRRVGDGHREGLVGNGIGV